MGLRFVCRRCDNKAAIARMLEVCLHSAKQCMINDSSCVEIGNRCRMPVLGDRFGICHLRRVPIVRRCCKKAGCPGIDPILTFHGLPCLRCALRQVCRREHRRYHRRKVLRCGQHPEPRRQTRQDLASVSDTHAIGLCKRPTVQSP